MPYQDKQLKKEFITVDNRTIPFGYPQFWGGDDWEVSGRDNPLPVANYTRNEQGLWVPVSKENPVPTQLTGSSLEDGQAMPVRTVGIKSTYIDLLDSPVSILPGMSHTTSIVTLTDCSDMTLAIRVQGSKKWRAIWQNRTENGAGLAATHLIDRRESAIPYDAKRESLKTPYGYAVVTNGESEEIVVESIAIVKWVVGGENNGA